MPRATLPALLFIAPLAASCGSQTHATDLDGGVCPQPDIRNFPFTTPDQVSSIPTGTTVTGGWHVPEGTPVTYDELPPVGGYHYPVWAVWGTHNDVIPHPYLAHNEEHGGVLLLYNCPSGCADLVTDLQRIVDSQPQDPLCASEGTGVNARILLAPDPSLDSQFAAASWGWWFKPGDGGCVNLDDLQLFIDEHTGHGREIECAQGGYQ